LKLLLSFLVSLLFLGLLFYLIPFDELIEALRKVPPERFLAGFALYSVSQVLRSVRWSILLGLPLSKSLLLNSANILLNLVLPARSGELSWFYYAKRLGVNFKASLWSFTAGRAYDLLALAWVVLFAYLFTRWGLLSLLSLLPLSLLLYLLPRLFLLLPSRGKLGELRAFLLRELTPSLSLKLFYLSFGSFLFKGAGAYSVAGHLFGLSPAEFFLAFFGGELSSVLPFHGFLGYGTYEAGFLLPLKLAGVEAERALLAGFVVHNFLLLSAALWGLPSILYLHTCARKSP